MSFVRCAAVAASPQLGVRRAQLSAGRASRCWLARSRQVAAFAFPADGWRRAASGEWRNVTGHQRLDLKGLARLPPEAPLKLRAWTSRGVRKTTQGTLADLLAALRAGPAHLTLRLLSSSEGVRLAWGVQESDPLLHALGGALPLHEPPTWRGEQGSEQGRCPCTSPPAWHCEQGSGRGAALHETPRQVRATMLLPARARLPAGAPRGLTWGTCLGEQEAKHSWQDASMPLLPPPATEAQVPSGFLQGGVCRPSVKGPSPVVLWAWAVLLLVAWLASLEDKAAALMQAVLQTVVCLAGILPTACRMCTRHWQNLRQKKEAQEGDIDFLDRRISFLTEEEMRALDAGSFLGRGGNGCVRRLLYGGVHAVRKEFVHEDVLLPMMREARFMLELRGAGGCRAPWPWASAPTIIQEFVGEPFDKFLRQCSVQGVLRSLGLLCRRLGEVHARDVVHNDLKTDNITVSGGVHRPVLHVIDLGWACRAGRVAGDFTLEMGEGFSPREGFANECPWMAPEVRARRPVFPSGDVFSLGFLLQGLAEDCVQPWLAVPLWRLGQCCTREDPSCRPSLHEVALAIAALPEELLQCQLQEAFHLVVRQ
ncbi:hypothetical protein O3P69_002596 [Scylla paramamosain]|uniref:Protein kinase domain-containing protein n=1 Tax=Scylla paramamosain TaxID=85552 RepID=A0AAW0UMI2_SCYPA